MSPTVATEQPAAIGVEAAGIGTHLGTLDRPGGFGDHVDDPSDRVGAVERRTGSSHDFNPGDVVDRHGPCLRSATVDGIIDREAVDQQQYLGVEFPE